MDCSPRRLLSKGQSSKGQWSKETFVQEHIVQGDICPIGQLSNKTFIQVDFCQKIHLSINLFVQGKHFAKRDFWPRKKIIFYIRRLLSRNNFFMEQRQGKTKYFCNLGALFFCSEICWYIIGNNEKTSVAYNFVVFQ